MRQPGRNRGGSKACLRYQAALRKDPSATYLVYGQTKLCFGRGSVGKFRVIIARKAFRLEPRRAEALNAIYFWNLRQQAWWRLLTSQSRFQHRSASFQALTGGSGPAPPRLLARITRGMQDSPAVSRNSRRLWV